MSSCTISDKERKSGTLCKGMFCDKCKNVRSANRDSSNFNEKEHE